MKLLFAYVGVNKLLTLQFTKEKGFLLRRSAMNGIPAPYSYYHQLKATAWRYSL
jgi:hypothetical protein